MFTKVSQTLAFIEKHPLRDDILEMYLKGGENVRAKCVVEQFISSLGCDPYECLFLEDMIKIRVNLSSIYIAERLYNGREKM